MTDDIELLAALLDGEIDPSQVSPELARLGDLAGLVHANVPVAAPSAAFTAALRSEVLEAFGTAGPGATALGTPTSSSAPGAGAASTATAAAGPAQALTAAVLAGTVLATSSFAAASLGAVPGDALYETKRTTEATQLFISSDARDVDLLLGFATERLAEALDVTDPATVLALLDEAGSTVDEALALVASLVLDVEDALAGWLPGHTDALLRLAAANDDAAVQDAIDGLLAQTMWLDTVGTPATDTSDDADGGTDGTTDGGTTDDGVTDTVDDTTDGVDDVTGDATDGVDDVVDDVTGDVTDGVDDVVDDVTDGVDDVIDDVTDGVDDVTDDVTDTVDDVTDGVGDTTGGILIVP